MKWLGIDHIKKFASSNTQFVNLSKSLKDRNNKPLNYSAVEETKLKREELLSKIQTIKGNIKVLTSIEDIDELNDTAKILDVYERVIKHLSEAS